VSIIPQELDWVARRAACTPSQVFAELVYGIENDVAVINEARSLPPEDKFVARMTGTGSTLIVCQLGYGNRPRVKLSYEWDAILAIDESTGIEYAPTLGINDEGRCILKLDGVELERWQFRKRLLENIFFGGQQ
jgi:hypothetical protein